MSNAWETNMHHDDLLARRIAAMALDFLRRRHGDDMSVWPQHAVKEHQELAAKSEAESTSQQAQGAIGLTTSNGYEGSDACKQ